MGCRHRTPTASTSSNEMMPLSSGFESSRPMRTEGSDLLDNGPKPPIVLRRINAGDLGACIRFPFSLSGVKALSTLRAARRAFELHGFWREDGGALAIASAADGRLLGTVQFMRSSPTVHGYEIGYLIHDKGDRGRGYASCALAEFSRQLFAERPHCHRLQLVISVNNEASWRVAERCGFRREGILRNSGLDANAPEDCFIYSKVRSDLRTEGRLVQGRPPSG